MKPIDAPIDKDVNWLVDRINEKSNGRIVMDIYPASQLGDYTLVQERIGLGAIDMQLACLGSDRDKRLQASGLPYLVSSWDQASKEMASGGFFMNTIGEIVEEQNIKLLAPWLNLFGGISLKELPPSPGDPDVPKGIKIRAPAMKVFELMAENLGYLPTPIPWAEAFVALQSGIVDGVIGGGYESTWANFKDVVNYYLHYNSHLDMYFWIINLDLWNSLSEEDQKILTDVGLELEKKRLAGAEADEGVFAQKLRDYGIETMTFSENELAKFTEKAHKNVWPAVKDDIGAEFMERLVSALGSR